MTARDDPQQHRRRGAVYTQHKQSHVNPLRPRKIVPYIQSYLLCIPFCEIPLFGARRRIWIGEMGERKGGALRTALELALAWARSHLIITSSFPPPPTRSHHAALAEGATQRHRADVVRFGVSSRFLQQIAHNFVPPPPPSLSFCVPHLSITAKPGLSFRFGAGFCVLAGPSRHVHACGGWIWGSVLCATLGR